jgi:hypothetical protein
MKITGFNEYPVAWRQINSQAQVSYQVVGSHQFVEMIDGLGNKYMVDLDGPHQAVSKKIKDFGGNYHRNAYYVFEGPDGLYTLYDPGIADSQQIFKGLPDSHPKFEKYVI